MTPVESTRRVQADNAVRHTAAASEHLAIGRCAAHFHASATRCELDAGHDGNHLVRGFAQWDEPLTHYPKIREELF